MEPAFPYVLPPVDWRDFDLMWGQHALAGALELRLPWEGVPPQGEAIPPSAVDFECWEEVVRTALYEEGLEFEDVALPDGRPRDGGGPLGALLDWCMK